MFTTSVLNLCRPTTVPVPKISTEAWSISSSINVSIIVWVECVPGPDLKLPFTLFCKLSVTVNLDWRLDSTSTLSLTYRSPVSNEKLWQRSAEKRFSIFHELVHLGYSLCTKLTVRSHRKSSVDLPTHLLRFRYGCVLPFLSTPPSNSCRRDVRVSSVVPTGQRLYLRSPNSLGLDLVLGISKAYLTIKGTSLRSPGLIWHSPGV